MTVSHNSHSIRTSGRNCKKMFCVTPHTQALSESEIVQSGDVGAQSRSYRAQESHELHARRAQGERVVLVSPVGHAQHVKVRVEEQHVRECAKNTWVSTWTSEQPVETAKTSPKRRPHIVKKV